MRFKLHWIRLWPRIRNRHRPTLGKPTFTCSAASWTKLKLKYKVASDLAPVRSIAHLRLGEFLRPAWESCRGSRVA
jgi:hypothetical protein